MQFKQYEKSMIVYRGRKKLNNNNNTSKYQLHHQNQSQNLKNIHRTLVEATKKENYLIPERSSVVFNKNPNHLSTNNSNSKQRGYRYKNSKSKLNISSSQDNDYTTMKNYESSQNLKSRQNSGSKEKPVNFYINIERLKNLKIESKRKNQHLVSNPYIKNSTNISLDKKSLYLRNSETKAKSRLKNHSYDNIQSTISKNQEKTKSRYKTDMNEIQQARNSQDTACNQFILPRKSNFRRTNHQLKDKSFIDGYLKGKQLGRGGFSKVWEGFNFKTKQFYAIKQIDTTNKYQTHLTQIWFGNHFFENGGNPKKQYSHHSGIKKLLKMFQYSIIDPRAFIVYENCDGSLGNMLYDIYEEDRDDQIDEDQKLYMIKYKSLYGQLRKSTGFLKSLIKSIAEALDLLVENKIVHSDIKTENILMKKIQQFGNTISAGRHSSYEFKLIDYGSSFIFQSLKQYKLATPEYMCPELLNYILFQNKKPYHDYMLEYIKLYENISAIDVWGLGCIVLELIHGLPLWLNNPTKILVNGKYQTKKGLFAVSDRSFSKILEKQLNIVNNFDHFLSNENNSCILIDNQIKSIIKCMLNPNPKYRIRPHEIIQRLSSNE